MGDRTMHASKVIEDVLVQEKKDIDNLRSEYENLLRQVGFINELMSTLLSPVDIEEMLEKIVSGLHRMLSIDRVGIWCLRESNRTFECRYSAGLDSSSLSLMNIPVDSVQDMLVEAATSKKLFFPHDTMQRFIKLIYESLQEEAKEALAFPIFSYRDGGCLKNIIRNTIQMKPMPSVEKEWKREKGGFTIGKDCVACQFFPIFGILWMDNKSSGKKFNHELITIYTLLLNMDIAVENKFLMKELQDISLKDSLTGAYNRVYLFSALEKEIERASRMKGRVSVSIIDLDNFKSINDCYGHQFGDRFLLEFSQLAQKSIRKMDYFCRYGGDEFVFILPEASPDQARFVMNRIIKRIKEQGICVNGKSLDIKLSCGIASFPKHTKNVKELMEYCDKALYQAKKLGKGRIEIYHYPSP